MVDKKMRLITWVDAVHSVDEQPLELSVCETLGFLIEEDADSITLAMESHDIGGEVSFRFFITIPKIAIRRQEAIDG